MYMVYYVLYHIHVYLFVEEVSNNFRTPVKKKTIDFQIAYNIYRRKNSPSFNFKLTRLHRIPSKRITLL